MRYYVATGKEEDSKAALAAEAGLKEAIDQSMRGTTNPARLEQITKLAREFRAFTKIFAEILKTKEESRGSRRTGSPAATMRYKLDDLPSNADGCRPAGDRLRRQEVSAQFQAAMALSTHSWSADKTVATSALAG